MDEIFNPVRMTKTMLMKRNRIFDAINLCDLPLVQTILDEVENKEDRAMLLNCRSDFDWTILHCAAYANRVDFIHWILSSSAEEKGGGAQGFSNVLARCQGQSTALHIAAANGHLEAFEAIVNGCQNKEERQALINLVNEDRRSVLHVAVLSGHTPVIDWILSSSKGRSAGFDRVVARDRYGNTALCLAVGLRNLDVCKAVFEGCITKEEREAMIQTTTEKNETILHIAVSAYHLPILIWILRETGFQNIEAKSQGLTAMTQAVRNRNLECLQAIVKGCSVENGQRERVINSTASSLNMTLLHEAVEVQSPSIVSWLLSSDAGGGREAGFNSIFATTLGAGLNAMQHAFSRGVDLRCIKALLQGCREDNGEREKLLNGVDLRGWSLLHIATHHNHSQLINWLLSEEEKEGGVFFGFERDKHLSSVDNHGLSVLHLAAASGNGLLIHSLVSHCSSSSEQRRNLFLRVEKDHGWTALHAAALLDKFPPTAALLQHPECHLIPNAKDKDGMTALHRAIIGGPANDAKWMLPFGLWVNRVNPAQRYSVVRELISNALVDVNDGVVGESGGGGGGGGVLSE